MELKNLLSGIKNIMQNKICIVGLGYVGLPLAVEFSKKFETIGFDISKKRVLEINSGLDMTREVESEDLRTATIEHNFIATTSIEDAKNCNIYIITVPTPVDKHKNPDMSYIIEASTIVGSVLKKNDIVIYESTVYPGATEEVCVPILEKYSNLIYNIDFFCGYSPERINPGDKDHTLTFIKKITSGSTPAAATIVDELYKSIIVAGTHPTSSIRVAEAAKVIENSQRDINIAFVNELALIFNKLGIDTHEVLNAARTKWNFLDFKPGLVGGHCIGVDPYYLTYKAQEVGYLSKIILAGRELNESMGPYIATQVIKALIKNGNVITGAKVLVMGITFKENCPDIRNSHVIDIIRELKDFGCFVDVCDPYADPTDTYNEYEINLIQNPQKIYSAVIGAVKHKEFEMLDPYSFLKNGIVYDVKNMFKKADYRL